MSNDAILIGDCRVDTVTGEVRGPGGAVRLEPKVLEVLLFLVAHRGEVVSKADLLAAVWSEAAVSDDVVWRCVAAVRRAFDDDPRKPQVIETLSRRGYRLIAGVSQPPGAETVANEMVRTGGVAEDRHFAAAALFGLIAVLGVITVGGPSAGTVPDAAEAVTTAVVSQPALPGSPKHWSAEDLTRVGREYYERRSQPDARRAIEIFQRATELSPDYAPGWAGLADAYAQQVSSFGGRLDVAERAVEAADRAVGLAPGSPAAHKARGFALTVAGRTGEAIDAYGRALALLPGFAPASVNLGALLGTRGRYHESLALYVDLDTRTLNRVVELHHIGNSLYQAGRLDEARDYLSAALRVDPLQSETIVTLARIDLLTGDLAAARGRVTAALHENPADYRLHIVAGEIATVEGDLPRARAELWRAVEDSREYPGIGAYVRLAWIDRQLGVRTPEVEDLVENYAGRISVVVERQRGWAHAQLAAAVALLDGDRDKAISWLRRALDLGHIEFRWLPIEPMFSQLHDDPEFEKLVAEAAALWLGRSETISEALSRGPLER